ncbi:MAG: glycoside hydrolase family 2 TIM barrel-domain containing protein [Lachnospiraceae bacterium]|nr:glycoside hydrolase family 2 protein [Lachnospiraceae bacterium]MDD6193003.1 glycoside hydrolase family 2 TIM barrel-domain containing protein [Lachnospiraceae bacterium]MDY4792926.1 glycoside hydrolase family 2 TIM barrel-domain containing protein [Pararoseburia sp.]
MENRIYLMRDWKFTETFTEDMISEPMTGDGVQKVSLPHTCKETPFHYFDESIYQMVSCYQRVIVPEESWKDNVILLTFEAVGHEADVYLNGKHLCNHKNGYTAFTVDLTNELYFGKENLLSVRVDSNENINQPPFGYVIDYMTYGGIYRDVYLEVKNPMYLEDVFLKPSFQQSVSTKGLSDEEIGNLLTVGVLNTEVTLSREAAKAETSGKLGIRQYIDGLPIVQSSQVSKSFSTIVKDVKLWDIVSPHLYDVTTQLLFDNQVVDEKTVSIGFREAKFEKDGFYLNGRKVKIRGLNRHQSYAYVGYAMPESMQRFDAKILKRELALNAVRTSHYPQSHYFVDECDRQGLLVFTEMPGWQHIGDEKWQDIAVENVKEMVMQYRNHPSIILWGVRINESPDNDAFYERTNAMAHQLDDTRQTGGVRCIKKSNLLEDVYTYNDFVHSGSNEGCEAKEKVTSNMEKGYLISEYNGHMYPTKPYDWEEHRREHMIRHANVLDAVASHDDIAGSFGWCMFDYNTHKDFGSGDRICYHGVMDMFRNPKLAAAVYGAQGQEDNVLELSSSMDIGEHPACNRGDTFLISNADSVRMYKNNVLIKEYTNGDSTYKNLAHGPILLNDYIGDVMTKAEGYSKRQGELVKYCMNSVALNGMKVTPKLVWAALQLIVIYHMNLNDAVPLYNKYIGDWGGQSKQYRFDAIKDGKVVKSIIKDAMTKSHLDVKCSQTTLVENVTYDVAELRIVARDENDNQLVFMQEPIRIETEGPIELIGPDCIPLQGGMTGIYVKSTGAQGEAKITLRCDRMEPVAINMQVICNTMREDN